MNSTGFSGDARGSFNGRAAIDETKCDAAGAIRTPGTWSSIVIGRQELSMSGLERITDSSRTLRQVR